MINIDFFIMQIMAKTTPRYSGTPITVRGGGIYFVNPHSTMFNGIKDSDAYPDIMAAMQGMRREGTAAK